jgi:formylglycine-generating enzyme required for sulfatase activity
MKTVFYSFAILCLGYTASANNLVVSNVTTTGANKVSDFTLVNFNLSWDNSWRTSTGPGNWDAAWVFVKFQVGVSNPVLTGASSIGTTVTVSTTANLRVGMPVVKSSGTGTFAANTVISSISSATTFVVSASPTTALRNATVTCLRIWEHASLSTSVGNHTAPAGSIINVPSDGTGVFIYRSANGRGTFSLSNVQLRWVYGTNGVPDDAPLQVQVFAVEMVYVPQGSFYVGSGGTETGSFTNGSWTSGATIPFQITSEDPLGIDNVAGKLWGTSSSNNTTIGNAATDAEATLAATFPKGHAAFYCMKYETSQGQYKDFLNALTYSQQVERTAVVPTSAAGTGALTNSNANRNGIEIQTPGNATTRLPAVYGCNLDADAIFNENVDGECIACSRLTWMDGCAYMDWAGLRPMTELEFEKACRGNQAPVADEFAWGNTIATLANNITNGGQAGEVTNTANANSVANNQVNVQGPLRGGAFAGAATSRVQAGATYYGIMEMSGNLWERVATVGNATGRAYTGTHGDGSLNTLGHANTTAWPGLLSGQVTGTSGSGFRAGGWFYAEYLCRVSERWVAAFADGNRNSDYGFRGVRRAP